MKRSSFIGFFVGGQILFILLHLHKQSLFIKYSYLKQKVETEKESLEKENEHLTHQLYTLHDRAQVKEFAQNKLDLKPMKITQIKKINHDTKF